MNSRLAAKTRVYISTKKFIKSEMGDRRSGYPPKIFYCKTAAFEKPLLKILF
jgi:hypothetical protein